MCRTGVNKCRGFLRHFFSENIAPFHGETRGFFLLLDLRQTQEKRNLSGVDTERSDERETKKLIKRSKFSGWQDERIVFRMRNENIGWVSRGERHRKTIRVDLTTWGDVDAGECPTRTQLHREQHLVCGKADTKSIFFLRIKHRKRAITSVEWRVGETETLKKKDYCW